ncbi:A disintegrin and metalloproteinase with thrombospondin motifs 4-like isoform X2 [Mytilus edulis]|uniref:A disintegrin and metalloproteinase with thrombospondin motifs 4-like isoform X2 n=1 Tax=Mytilus edulis TaxID=6550 RepID=UPI0039EE91CB
MYCSHEEWGVGNCNHNEDVGIYCFNKTTVLGGWSPWTTWSVCSDYGCNDGLQSRSRRCDWPLPSDKSFYCKGTSMEIKSSNSTLNPGSRSITQSDLEGDNHNSNTEESYDDLRINQSISDYSVRTNQHNTTNTTNRESNVPFETYDNLGQDFYENAI